MNKQVTHLIMLIFLMGMAVGFASCQSAPPGYFYGDLSEDSWERKGRTCRRTAEEGPRQRVINRTDPELCGRNTYKRPKYFVRISPEQKKQN